MMGPTKPKPKPAADPYADIVGSDPYADIVGHENDLQFPAAATADASGQVPKSEARAKGLGDLSAYDTGRAALDAAGLGFPSRFYPGLLEGVNQNNRLAGTVIGSVAPGIPAAKLAQGGGVLARFLKGAATANAMSAVSAGNHAQDGERNAAALTAALDPRTALLGGALNAAPQVITNAKMLRAGGSLVGELPDNVLSLKSLWKSAKSLRVAPKGYDPATLAQQELIGQIEADRLAQQNEAYAMDQARAAKNAARVAKEAAANPLPGDHGIDPNGVEGMSYSPNPSPRPMPPVGQRTLPTVESDMTRELQQIPHRTDPNLPGLGPVPLAPPTPGVTHDVMAELMGMGGDGPVPFPTSGNPVVNRGGGFAARATEIPPAKGPLTKAMAEVKAAGDGPVTVDINRASDLKAKFANLARDPKAAGEWFNSLSPADQHLIHGGSWGESPASAKVTPGTTPPNPLARGPLGAAKAKAAGLDIGGGLRVKPARGPDPISEPLMRVDDPYEIVSKPVPGETAAPSERVANREYMRKHSLGSGTRKGTVWDARQDPMIEAMKEDLQRQADASSDESTRDAIYKQWKALKDEYGALGGRPGDWRNPTPQSLRGAVDPAHDWRSNEELQWLKQHADDLATERADAYARSRHGNVLGEHNAEAHVATFEDAKDRFLEQHMRQFFPGLFDPRSVGSAPVKMLGATAATSGGLLAAAYRKKKAAP